MPESETNTNVPESLVRHPEKPTKKESFFLESLKFIILAAIIVLPFRTYVAEPYVVQGASMFPTFDTGHYLIIDKFTHYIGGLERGDVIVFKYPNDPKKSYIKRIIGLPGETVKITDRKVTVKAVGAEDFITLAEPYINNALMSDIEMVLTDSQYFVMGDNRGNSSDSRFWGPLEESYIKGEPLVRALPITAFGIQPGDYQY